MTRAWKESTLWVALLIAAMLLLPSAVWAQAARGTLTGTIRDPSGAAVPNTPITVTNVATAVSWKIETSSSGSYTVPGLPPGTYEVLVKAPGFNEQKQIGITVAVGDTVTNDITLKVGDTQQTIQVEADASQLKTENSEVGTNFSPQMVKDLPLNVGGAIRNPIAFIGLAAGTSGSTPSGVATGADPGFKINGGQEEGVDIQFEGASMIHVGPSQGMSIGISQEVVQEFRVVTNTFSAEYGRTTGGLINMVSKSGTNQLHGSGYEILVKDQFDANGWMNNRLGVPRASLTQNDFGFQLSGPVILPKVYNGKDKTFFLVNYETYRQNSSSPSSLTTLPTAAFRSGDFSLMPEVVIDPASCNAGICTPFAGNKIPGGRLSQVSQKLNSYLPVPDLPGLQNNTTITGSKNNNTIDRWTYKIDQNLSARQKLSGSFSTDYLNQTGSDSLGPLFRGGFANNDEYARANYTFIVTPTVVNELNLAYTRRYRDEGVNGSLSAQIPSHIGLAGVANTGFPCVGLNNWIYGGSFGCGESNFTDNTYTLNDNLNWVHGRHNFKMGFQGTNQEFNVRRLTYTTGNWQFDRGQTSDGIDPNTGIAYASYMLGLPNYLELNKGRVLGMRTKYYAAFLQDSIKLTPKLTINLGLRYDIPRPTTEAHNRLSWMDPTVPNADAGNLPGAYVFAGSGAGRNGRSSAGDQYWKALGPRVGLAYSVTPSTVIRAGYGIYYSALKVSGYTDNDAFGFFGDPRYGNELGTTRPPLNGFMGSSYTWDQGAPTQFVNTLSPSVQNGQQPSMVYSPTARPGTIHNWTFDVQQQLGKNWLLDVAYIGAHGDHLQAYTQDANQLNPKYQSRGACLQADITQQGTDPGCSGQPVVPLPFAGFSGSVGQALRPFPQYGSFLNENSQDPQPNGFYSYEALQIKLNHRFSNGLTLMVNYTWSKNLTDADHEFPSTSVWSYFNAGGPVQNAYNRRADKALSEVDVPRRLVLAYSYELPVGKGKKFLNKGGLAGGLVGGWSIAGTQIYQDGFPTAVMAGYTDGTFSQGRLRANVVVGANPKGYSGSFNFDTSSLYNPAAFSVPAPYTFGNGPKSLGAVRMLNLPTENVSLQKKTKIKERVDLIFRAEFFDLFNRHTYTFPGDFNMLTSPQDFGKANGSAGSRSGQLTFRADF